MKLIVFLCILIIIILSVNLNKEKNDRENELKTAYTLISDLNLENSKMKSLLEQNENTIKSCSDIKEFSEKTKDKLNSKLSLLKERIYYIQIKCGKEKQIFEEIKTIIGDL